MLVMVKFKGIDGGLYKWWSMWFNLMICEEFYLGLNVIVNLLKDGVLAMER
jgi:hypothetical protein